MPAALRRFLGGAPFRGRMMMLAGRSSRLAGKPLPRPFQLESRKPNSMNSASMTPGSTKLRREKLGFATHSWTWLPIILVANVPGGLHAITLNGYSLRNDPVRTTEIIGDKPAIPMNGLRIDKFYGHDDQLGPFCRLVVQDAPANSPYPIQFLREGTIAHPIAVIIPVYNKVRLTFLDDQMWISRIHQVLKILVRPTSTVEWNIGLLFSNDYKRAVRESELLSDDLKRAIVMSALPRFVWYCALSVDGRIVVDFIIDATGLARSFPVYLIAWRDASLAAAMVKLMNVASLEKTLRGIFSDRFFDFLKSSLRDGLPVTRIF